MGFSLVTRPIKCVCLHHPLVLSHIFLWVEYLPLTFLCQFCVLFGDPGHFFSLTGRHLDWRTWRSILPPLELLSRDSTEFIAGRLASLLKPDID